MQKIVHIARSKQFLDTGLGANLPPPPQYKSGVKIAQYLWG